MKTHKSSETSQALTYVTLTNEEELGDEIELEKDSESIRVGAESSRLAL